MHVVLLELAIDPICALVFESEPSDKSAMRQPPRRPDEPLFGMRQLGLAILQGAGALAGILGLYVWLLRNHPADEARGAAFCALAMTNLVLALADAMAVDGRLFEPHRRIFWIIAGALLSILALVFLVPGLSAIFGVAMPDSQSWVLATIVALIGGAWMSVAMRARQLLLTHAGNRASASC
jgi:Ca2+-transporting ATPase